MNDADKLRLIILSALSNAWTEIKPTDDIEKYRGAKLIHDAICKAVAQSIPGDK